MYYVAGTTESYGNKNHPRGNGQGKDTPGHNTLLNPRDSEFN